MIGEALLERGWDWALPVALASALVGAAALRAAGRVSRGWGEAERAPPTSTDEPRELESESAPPPGRSRSRW